LNLAGCAGRNLQEVVTQFATNTSDTSSQLEAAMAQVKDPVCGMTIDSAKAAGQSTHQGTTYYFCSPACKKQFDASPSKFVAGGAPRSGGESPARH
jgi:YHS domain-containing protein